MSKHRYQTEVVVMEHECDLQGKLTIDHLLHHCFENANQQYLYLSQTGSIGLTADQEWIITQNQMTFYQWPNLGDLITIETQAKSYSRFFCMRNFYIYNEVGDLIIEIINEFALINIETRQLEAIPESVNDFYGGNLKTKAEKISKVRKINHDQEPQLKNYQVSYFDIDRNRHVNNTVYFKWMMDSLGIEFLLAHHLKKLVVRYANEILYGNHVQVYSQVLEEEGQKESRHQIFADGKSACQAHILWD